MKKWRKNIVAGAVLVTVCAGVYMNWHYGEQQAATGLTSTLNESKLLSTDLLVMGDMELAVEGNNDTTMSQYFASVRLSRQEARDSAVTILQEAMAYDENAQMEQTNQQLENIVQTALCEAQIESLVIAKGYRDCVAYITEEGISLAVASPEGGLAQNDVAVIADVVLSQSDFSMEDIRIVEVY